MSSRRTGTSWSTAGSETGAPMPAPMAHGLVQDQGLAEADVFLPDMPDGKLFLQGFLHHFDHGPGLGAAPVVGDQDLMGRHALPGKAQQAEPEDLGAVIGRNDNGYFHGIQSLLWFISSCRFSAPCRQQAA